MKTITKFWAKIPAQAQSAIRHLVTTFVVTFAVTAQPLLAGIWAAPDLKTAKALVLAGILAAGVAAVRVAVPIAKDALVSLGAWLFARLAS
jgi:hypothetical protein